MSCPVFEPMQRDFMVNALRTRTKYNLTSIRKGMKREILQSLTEMFGNDVRMSMPMVHFKESMERDYAGAEVTVEFRDTHESNGNAVAMEQPGNKTRRRSRSINKYERSR